MTRIQFRTITILGFILLAFAAAAQQTSTWNSIPGDVAAAAKGWKMIQEGALLIDVRSREEYAGGHIEGSSNVPHTEIGQIKALIGEDHSRPVVLYCRSGRRVGWVMDALEKEGYTGLFNASGYQALEATRPESD